MRSGRLLGVLATLVGGGALLYALAGPPHLPERMLSWALISSTLGGSDVPLDAVAYVFTTAAWLLWIYIVGSLDLAVASFVTATASVTDPELAPDVLAVSAQGTRYLVFNNAAGPTTETAPLGIGVPSVCVTSPRRTAARCTSIATESKSALALAASAM